MTPADPPTDLEPLSEQARHDLARRWNAHSGIAHIGARLEIVSRDEVRAIVDPIAPHHRGGMGTAAVNGPTIAAIFDLLIGLTGSLQAPGRRVAVAQLNIRFLRPVMGSRFSVVSRPERVARSFIFVGCELRDERGVACARSEGLVAVSLAEATGELAL